MSTVTASGPGRRARQAGQTRQIRQIRPARLRPGSRVAVISPSGRSDGALLEEGCRVLAGWGLDVRASRGGGHELGYLAGRDAERAADLQRAWLDPEVEAVLCAHGGYGAQRIADRLDWAAMAAVPPKIFTGFSDITALHEAFALRLGVPTLHAPNVGAGSFTAYPQAQEDLRRALFEPDRPQPPLLAAVAAGAGDGARDGARAGDDAGCLAPGRAAGLSAGGNLTLIVAGLGTADGRQHGGFAGCVLLLEDVHEECYRLDRLLTQLLRSGALDGVAGIALGGWTDCGPPPAVRRVMRDRLGGLGVPVLWGLGFGHVAPQPTLPLGVPAEIDADAGTLTFLEPAVA